MKRERPTTLMFLNSRGCCALYENYSVYPKFGSEAIDLNLEWGFVLRLIQPRQPSSLTLCNKQDSVCGTNRIEVSHKLKRAWLKPCLGRDLPLELTR
jgi:hypothetical protein